MSPRGVALVNALVVVAALAAISAGLLIAATRAQERLALRNRADQVSAYLDAGQAQALADLGTVMAALQGGGVRPGQDWARPRDLPIGEGRVAWRMEDLQGRFNLAWLADEGDWGAAARPAFLRLAEAQGVSSALAQRLLRAAGPDPRARAEAFGAAAPALPLVTPLQLAGVPGAAEGGAAALAPLLPFLAALPADAALNPQTAPLPVLRALIPGLEPRDWDLFEAARAAGTFRDADELFVYASALWPESALAALVRIPFGTGSEWFGLNLEARLDTLVLRRSAVVALTRAPDPARPEERVLDPHAVLTLPMPR